MVVSAAVVFLVVYQDTGAQLKSRDRPVTSAAIRPRCSSPLDALERQRRRSNISSAAARYVLAQPYDATSTLLFVLLPDGAAASNHPEVFGGGAPDEGETVAQQQVENVEGRKLLVPRLGFSTARFADVGKMRIFEQRADLGTVP